ncbi:hypothetical protein IJ579_06965 [bacterium]|nr:hypothetical protein [bacterium]
MANFLTPMWNAVARAYGGDKPGKMLIHTGIIGWAMSSIAQIAAIVLNDKIPKEQKMFMVPQEAADAAANILSFYLITRTFTSVASKLVSRGKWLPEAVKNFLLKDTKIADKIGKSGFDVEASGLLSGNLLDDYKDFRRGIDVTSTLIGTVISCNIVTPVLRNLYASHKQKDSIKRYNEYNKKLKQNIHIDYYKRPTMADFQSGSSLKI